MLKPFKIKVEGEEHSREIQEWLFSLGYNWVSGSKNPRYLGALYLVFSKEIRDVDPTIGWSNSSTFFKESSLPEKWFYDGKLQDEPKPQTLPDFKIKVESSEHSKAIQEFVFSMGYHWWSLSSEPNQTIRDIEDNYLYFEKSYKEDKPSLTATNDYRAFDSMDIPEMWFYEGKLQDHPPKNTLLEELHHVLNKYDISISIAQDCDNSCIMSLKSGSDETLSVYFEDKINSETIQEYIDACTIRDVEFEQSSGFEPHIVNYLGKDILVPYTFKRGWLATDEDGSTYVYKQEPVISPYDNIFGYSSKGSVTGIDYEKLGKMDFKFPYKNWKESKLFFDISDD